MSVGINDTIVVHPLALVQLAEDSGLAGRDRLFHTSGQIHDGEVEGSEGINLLRGVDVELFAEAKRIGEGSSRLLMGRSDHVIACWTYLTNLTAALEAERAIVADLRGQLAVAEKEHVR